MIRRRLSTDVIVAVAMFAAALAISFTAIKLFRSHGIQPRFYQGNFVPAVMMACGRGFVTFQGEVPPELNDFLQLRANGFDCALLSESLPKLPVTWNATWYYLYGTTALVWKLTGISWTALDGLAATFGAFVGVALFGLFRLVTPPLVAAAMTLVLFCSPANLNYLMALRDYSKAPFVLMSVLVLAWLVTLEISNRARLALAAGYGAIVGLGYGFRSDLAVMVPFGAAVVAALQPGKFRPNLLRNFAGTAVLLAVFALTAWPALRGLSRGGCQFHYSLLGLTRPLVNDLGMAPSIYQFGGHFLDTFVDLKVGDYGHRMLDMTAPNLCAPDYDIASGALFRGLATTFPADLVAHAYGSMITILRSSLTIPAMMQSGAPSAWLSAPAWAYGALNALTLHGSAIGVLLTLAAIGCAWARSTRLGIALTIFILFLTGYPAIEFEERHWFHLRFISWWAGLMIAADLLSRRGQWNRAAVRRAAVGTIGLVVAMALALGALRIVQARSVSGLIASYLATPAEPLAIEREANSVRVDWKAESYAARPGFQMSALLVAELNASKCEGSGPFGIAARYAADTISHDMSTETLFERPSPGQAPTRVYIPVFAQGFMEHTYLRFDGLETVGATAECIAAVSQVTDLTRLPLWLEMHVAPGWEQHPLYQSIRTPRWLRSIIASW